MKSTLHSTVHRNPYSDRIEIRLVDVRPGVTAAYAQPLEFVTCERDGAEWAPAFLLRPDEAQALFDEFCRAGFKPSHQVDAASALQATRDHLADMRKIAFNGLRAAGIQPNAQAAIDDGLEAWAKGGDA